MILTLLLSRVTSASGEYGNPSSTFTPRFFRPFRVLNVTLSSSKLKIKIIIIIIVMKTVMMMIIISSNNNNNNKITNVIVSNFSINQVVSYEC